MSSPRTARIVLCLVAAGLWGLWWAPIRWLESAGMEGPYAGLAMNVGALPVLLAGALVWRGRMGWQAALGAIAVGGAVTLYASALLFTDVVRCVLLFYLAPAWSTLIECLFMGRRWNLRSTLALSMSLLGAVLVFRGDISLAALNSGDAMALGAGVVWSVGAALIFLQQERNPAGLALLACFAAIVMGGAFALVSGPVPAGETILAATPLAIGTGAVFLAPILGITLWAALNLPPATVTFLMTAEIITGVVSSAMFLDVRFGLPEALGTVLIATAALVEVVAPSPEVMRAGEERA